MVDTMATLRSESTRSIARRFVDLHVSNQHLRRELPGVPANAGGRRSVHDVLRDDGHRDGTGEVQLLNEAAAGGPISQAACTGTGVLTSVTEALAQVTTYERGEATNLVQSVTDALGRVTSVTYDANGNVLTITDPGNNVRTLTYEPTFSKVTSAIR